MTKHVNTGAARPSFQKRSTTAACTNGIVLNGYIGKARNSCIAKPSALWGIFLLLKTTCSSAALRKTASSCRRLYEKPRIESTHYITFVMCFFSCILRCWDGYDQGRVDQRDSVLCWVDKDRKMSRATTVNINWRNVLVLGGSCHGGEV